MPRYRYDLFVICARANVDFVNADLLPRLGVSPERTLVLGAFTPGATISDEVERGISESRYAIVVLSPAFLADRWAAFGEQLASYSNTMKGRLVPLVLEACAVPARLEFLVALDFTDPSRRDAEAERLRRHLFAEAAEPPPVVPPRPEPILTPPPIAPPVGPESPAPPPVRGRVLTRILGLVALLGALLTGAMLLRRPPVDRPPDRSIADAAPVVDASPPAPAAVVAGTVVDAKTNRALGQVVVAIGGTTGHSDDSGNFRLVLPPAWPRDEPVSLRASKSGYKPLERLIRPPERSLILPLERE